MATKTDSLGEFRAKLAEAQERKDEANVRLGVEKLAAVRKEPLEDLSTDAFEKVKMLRAEAKEIAKDYVEANDFSEFEGLEIPHLVNLIDIARVKGDKDAETRIDMFLLAKFEPQRIVGNALPGQGRR